MNLFIDSNIFLNFYHFSNDDLEELKKLAALIENKDVKLLLPNQIKDEVRRNRDNKVSDAYKRFCDSKLEVSLPQICKTYPEFEKIKSLLFSIRKVKSDLIIKLEKDMSEKTLSADVIIGHLFDLAHILDTDCFIELAVKRYNLGNPPGKNKSYGDAINWESLLGSVPDKEDIFFISDDKDYRSPLVNSKFNSFLLDEWESKKKSKLYFYTQLSSFFNEHLKDIKLRVEEEKNQLIERLSQSGSFSSTHSLIGKLSKFDGFSDTQIKDIIEASIENSQIYLIAPDSDVKSFFRGLILERESILEKKLLSKFKWRFFKEELSDGPSPIPDGPSPVDEFEGPFADDY